MTGIQYTDANAVLPTKAILAIASIMCALMFLSVIWTKSWRLPIVGVVLLLVVSVVVGGIFPALIQSLRVKPSEKSLEAPYIQNNINATRDAFGLANVATTAYNASTTATQGQLRNDTTTVPGIRILDPNVVSATYKQLQALKSYYQFPDTLDVDRYNVDGLMRDTVIAVRELDLDGVPDGQRNWLNDHTVYTHGYGIVAAYGNRKDADGKPVFFEQNIPSAGSLGEFEPRIYFGEQSPDYSIVGAPAGASPREFDFPDASPAGQANTTYKGEGGVPLGSLPVKVAYAIKYREMNFLLSDAVNSDSRLLDHRTPRDRVQRVAPWLTLDGNAYPAVVDNRVQWIVDGYTTTADYPNSHLTSIDQATSDSITTTRTSVQAVAAGQVNYIRNSVKATVDASDGHRPPVCVGRVRPDAQGVDGRLPRHRPATVGHQRRPDGPPALPRGPLQGAARDPRPLPRDRPGHVLRQQRPLEGALRTRPRTSASRSTSRRTTCRSPCPARPTRSSR